MKSKKLYIIYGIIIVILVFLLFNQITNNFNLLFDYNFLNNKKVFSDTKDLMIDNKIPNFPFQISRFKSINDLNEYIVSQFNDKINYKLMILENGNLVYKK